MTFIQTAGTVEVEGRFKNLSHIRNGSKFGFVNQEESCLFSWFIFFKKNCKNVTISKGNIKRMKKAHCKLAAVVFITQDELT